MRLADKQKTGWRKSPSSVRSDQRKVYQLHTSSSNLERIQCFFLLSFSLNEVASRKLRLIIAISCPIVYFSVHYYPGFFCWSASVALSPSVVHHLGRPWFGGSPNMQGLLCTVVVTDFENLSGTAATTSSNPCQTHSI